MKNKNLSLWDMVILGYKYYINGRKRKKQANKKKWRRNNDKQTL